ncbi:MAG TPA: DUF6328 family protein, partial [Terriglobales bacterium]
PESLPMADLKSKVEDALNEGRILILGGQVIIGAALRLYYFTEFEKLPRALRLELTVALGLMLVAIGILLLPAAYHQIVDLGEDTAELHRRSTKLMDLTLIAFAIGLGSYVGICCFNVVGTTGSWIIGLFAFALAIAFWYVAPWSAKHHDENDTHHKLKQEESEKRRKQGYVTGIDEKIKTALIECRMALPGAQALLGFQLVTFFEPGFQPLPRADKLLHVGSLLAVGISTVFLMAPAAFHRIAEAGENTPRMYKFTSRMLLVAMFFLGLGICSDFALVLHKVTESYVIAVAIGAGLLAFYNCLWFAYTAVKRTSSESKLVPQLR